MKIKKYFFLLMQIGFLFGITLSCNDDLEDELVSIEQVPQESDDDDEDDNDEDDDSEDEDDDDDDEIVKHPSLFFIQLPGDIDDDEVEDLKEELNAEQVWHIEEINLRLWNTTTFPYTDAQGQQITNIDGQIVRARRRPRVEEANLNLGTRFVDSQSTNDQICFDGMSLVGSGETDVKISIFDTGFDPNNMLSEKITGYDYLNEDELPDDQNGHGTQVTLLIHDLVNQVRNAPNILFDIRKTHDANGVGFFSALIPAIVDAVNEDVNIMNFSFSYKDVNENTEKRPLRLAIDYAEANGVLMVASAGNSNTDNDQDRIISFPASYPNTHILATTSLTCKNKLSNFGSYGSTGVDLAFLGENIPTTGLNGVIANKSGTSYTSAVITAMSAIMASHQNQVDVMQIKCALIENSDYNKNLKNLVLSQGVVNFDDAIQNLGYCN